MTLEEVLRDETSRKKRDKFKNALQMYYDDEIIIDELAEIIYKMYKKVIFKPHPTEVEYVLGKLGYHKDLQKKVTFKGKEYTLDYVITYPDKFGLNNMEFWENYWDLRKTLRTYEAANSFIIAALEDVEEEYYEMQRKKKKRELIRAV